MDKLLDFKNKKVETLSIEDLSKTVKETSVGREPINGISHTDLFSSIITIFENSNLDWSHDTIYATDGGAKQYPGVTIFPEKEEQFGENDIRAHLLRRLLTSFTIKDLEDDISTHTLAVSYHQSGIEVAFGPNIKICSNQCILGRGMSMKTFGNGKIGPQKMLEVITGWLKDYQIHRERDLEVLNNMMNHHLHVNDVFNLVGELTAMRIGKDSNKLNLFADYALSQNQITTVTEKYLLKYKDNPNFYKDPETEPISLYDFYNMATELYKPGQTDLPNIIGRNDLFGQYLIDRYDLYPSDN